MIHSRIGHFVVVSDSNVSYTYYYSLGWCCIDFDHWMSIDLAVDLDMIVELVTVTLTIKKKIQLFFKHCWSDTLETFFTYLTWVGDR